MKVAFARHRDLTDIPSAGEFDLAILHHVLEHVTDPLIEDDLDRNPRVRAPQHGHKRMLSLRGGFDAPGGEANLRADAAVLALGGASWPRLGSETFRHCWAL